METQPPIVKLSRTISPINSSLGTLLVAGGTGALNQYAERRYDTQMRRTARRPLAAGRLKPSAVLWFGRALSSLGTVYLSVAVNLVASLLALGALLSYLFLYPPLKRKSPLCTVVGGGPGALPVLVGWAAASGRLSGELPPKPSLVRKGLSLAQDDGLLNYVLPPSSDSVRREDEAFSTLDRSPRVRVATDLGRFMSVPGHFKAALDTLAAGFGTLFQLRVHASADLFATASTSFAGLGANPAHIGMQVGAPKHEIGASEAHFCTILQAPDMICFDILAGFFKRILDGFGTSGMASVAIVDSRLHAFISQHRSSSFENSDSDV